MYASAEREMRMKQLSDIDEPPAHASAEEVRTVRSRVHLFSEPRVLRGSSLLVLLLLCASAWSSPGERPVERHYVTAPSAPASQTAEAAQAKSAGCMSCHTQTDASTMHTNPAVKLGCADCHGGDAAIRVEQGAQRGTASYTKAMESAHVLPRFPQAWHYPSSANPQRTYTLLNRESPEFVRFINPSDYRLYGDRKSVV